MQYQHRGGFGWRGQNRAVNLTAFRLAMRSATGHLPKLVEDLSLRLSQSSATMKDSDAVFSAAAVAHGRLRLSAGLAIPAMLVHESRILQVNYLRHVTI